MQPSEAASPEAQLDGFIAKFSDEDQAWIRSIREAMRKKLPTAHELVYDNYNFFVIGYSPTERPSDSILSIAACANKVSVCFLHGIDLPDPYKLLHGSGNQVRFLRTESAEVLDRPEVEDLLNEAISRTKPLPETGPGKLIIRSVSAKQRPRRKEKK